eukprot:6173234-Pleurochrysis_carterae.AAC.2
MTIVGGLTAYLYEWNACAGVCVYTCSGHDHMHAISAADKSRCVCTWATLSTQAIDWHIYSSRCSYTGSDTPE